MSHKVVVCIWILTLGLSMVALVHAEPAAAPTRKAMPGLATPEHRCGPNEEAVRTLKLTAIEDGVRFDYTFVRPGPRTWTNLNRPLLKGFGMRVGGIFCLPRVALVEQVSDGDLGSGSTRDSASATTMRRLIGGRKDIVPDAAGIGAYVLHHEARVHRAQMGARLRSTKVVLLTRASRTRILVQPSI